MACGESTVHAEEAVKAGWGPALPVSYTRKDMIIYALGIGCDELRYVYENDADFGAHPLFPVVLPFRGTATDVTPFPSPFMMDAMHASPTPVIVSNPAGILDAERYLELLEPLPVEGTFGLKSRTVAVLAKRSGAVVENESVLLNKAGRPVARLVAAAFYRGVGGFKSVGASKIPSVAIPTDSPPDHVLEQTLSTSQPAIYRLSGDFNPLHIDPVISGMVGFEKPIMHGLCSLGFATRAVMQAVGKHDVKAIKARFSRPVVPGSTLVTSAWVVSPTRVVFQTQVAGAPKPCLSGCFVEFASPITAAGRGSKL